MQMPLPKWLKEMRDEYLLSGDKFQIHDHGKSLVSIYRANGDVNDAWDVASVSEGRIPSTFYGCGDGNNVVVQHPTRVFEVTITRNVNGRSKCYTYLYTEGQNLLGSMLS